MVSADCETTLEIVPASLTGTSKLRPQLPPSWGRNRPSRDFLAQRPPRKTNPEGWRVVRIRCRAERIRSPSIEVLEVTLGDMQNSEKFRLVAAGVAARASHYGSQVQRHVVRLV